MAGKKGRSGRKRLPEKDVKEAIEALSSAVPELLEKLKVIALGLPIECPQCGKDIPGAKPDRDSLVYLLDRVLGRPRQETDLRVRGQVLMLTADDYEMATRTALTEQREALECVSTTALIVASNDPVPGADAPANNTAIGR
jgi:hypothetical protein